MKLEGTQSLTLDQYQKVRYKVPPEVLETLVASVGKEIGAEGSADEKGVIQAEKSTILLRLNFDAFAVAFMHEICAEFVTSGYGPEASEVRCLPRQPILFRNFFFSKCKCPQFLI
jgi:hypothetical protein